MRIHWTLKFGGLIAAFLLLSAPGVFGPGVGAAGCVQLIGAAMEAGQQERELQQANVNAARGDAEAQYVLGHRELFIIGGELKAEEGRLWLCRAAAQGHASAQYDLGRIYAGDLDRMRLTLTYDYPRDDAYAYKWLTLADRGAHRLAGSRLAELSKTISPADRTRGEKLLENWRTEPCGPPIIR